MSDKVTITQKQADDLKAFDGCSMDSILFDIVRADPSKKDLILNREALSLWHFGNNHGWMKLCRVLNGEFEIEQTPEDKVREWYQDLQAQLDNANKASVHTHVLVRELTTIDKCLEFLNIKISGVNEP